jgi:hypothetical protein
MPSLLTTRSCSFPIAVRQHQLSCAVAIQRHRHPSPSPSAEVSVSHRSHRCQSLSPPSLHCLSSLSLVTVSHRCNLLSVAAVLPIYRPLPPPPPPFLVGGRHHCHLLSAVTTPLVASTIAHQLQSLVSATVTSKHPDKW